MTLIAQVSDLHLGPVPFPAPWPLKPVLGWINWARQPDVHDNALFAASANAVAAAMPDHVAVTGDLIELGLDSEWRAAGEALARFGPPGRVSWAPGNHDVYTAGAVQRAARAMAPWLGAASGAEKDLRRHFPRLDIVGEAAIVTLCSGLPTWLFSAEGALGALQLARLDRMLAGIDRDRHLPIIAVHHPPVAPDLSRLKRLRDADRLLALLARHRCPLVLHGHLHKACRTEWRSAAHVVTGLGAASASATGRGGDDPASFNLIKVERTARGLGWTAETRLSSSHAQVPCDLQVGTKAP
jgi:3',5'-cyclic AMP phosphodiesterase CpdA